MDRFVGRLSRALGVLAALCLTFVMVATALDVGRRWLTGQAIPGVIESGEVLMVAIVYLGLALTQRRKAHVSMSLVADRLAPRRAAAMRAVGLAVAYVVLVWVLIATGQRAIASFAAGEYRWGMVRIYVWPARMLITLGITVLLLELALDIARLLRVARGREDVAAGVTGTSPTDEDAPPMV